MERDHIKINKRLLPLSWLYGLGVRLRNELFEPNVLKSRQSDILIISVGNITVGGSSKTPHVEYLIRLLKDKTKVTVFSRDYKRKNCGYVLANENTPMREIDDEPCQMKTKFSDIRVVADKKRCEGIDRLTPDEETRDTDIILLDDAFQRRYVHPDINILLVDYHRLIIYDKLFPAGRLREPLSGKGRVNIVIITKYLKSLNPIDYRVLSKAMELYLFQQLYFTTLGYCDLKPIFSKGRNIPLTEIRGKNILLLAGIMSPKQLELDSNSFTGSNALTILSFPDHHVFTTKDIHHTNETSARMPELKLIVTTEKDKARLVDTSKSSDEVRENIYVLPIKVSLMLDKEEVLNQKIISYVRKNPRNSILAKREDDHKSKDSHHSEHRSRTVSSRDNR